MTAEEYLLQIKDITVRIKERKDQLIELKSTIHSISGVRYDSTKVSSSVSDQMASKIVRLETLEEQIKEDVVKLQEVKADVMNTIMSVNNYVYRDLLINRYVKVYPDGRMMSLLDVSKKIKYSYDRTKHLHIEAINYLNSTLFSTSDDVE